MENKLVIVFKFEFKATCEDIKYVTLKSANKCLKSHHTLLSWINANETCVMEEGSLISISTPDMLEEISNLTTAIGKYLHIYANRNIIYINLCQIFRFEVIS